MHKLLENAKKELKQIEETGLNAGNLDNAYKLVDIAKKYQQTTNDGGR